MMMMRIISISMCIIELSLVNTVVIQISTCFNEISPYSAFVLLVIDSWIVS